MFHFPRYAHQRLHAGVIRLSADWVAPFGNLRIKGCLPPPRSLSQAATSFIASSMPRHPSYALVTLPTSWQFAAWRTPKTLGGWTQLIICNTYNLLIASFYPWFNCQRSTSVSVQKSRNHTPDFCIESFFYPEKRTNPAEAGLGRRYQQSRLPAMRRIF